MLRSYARRCVTTWSKASSRALDTAAISHRLQLLIKRQEGEGVELVTMLLAVAAGGERATEGDDAVGMDVESRAALDRPWRIDRRVRRVDVVRPLRDMGGLKIR